MIVFIKGLRTTRRSKVNGALLVANQSYPSLNIFFLFHMFTIPLQIIFLERHVFNKRNLDKGSYTICESLCSLILQLLDDSYPGFLLSIYYVLLTKLFSKPLSSERH